MSLETLYPQTSQPDGEAAVRTLYTQLMGGWNKGNGEYEWKKFKSIGKGTIHLGNNERPNGQLRLTRVATLISS